MNLFSNKKLEKFKQEIILILDSIEHKLIEPLNSKEQLSNDIIKIIISIADTHMYICPNIDEEEIYQETYKILLEASLIDNSKFYGKFESYTKLIIKEKIELLFLESKIDMYLSGRTKKILRKYTNAIIELTEKLGKNPTIYEIADLIGEDIEKIKRIDIIYRLYNNPNNLRGINFEIEDYSLTEIQNKEILKLLISEFFSKNILSKEELCVVILYYGIIPTNLESIEYNGRNILLDGKPKTLDYIGKIMSYTSERCRQLINSAYQKLAISDEMIELSLFNYAMNPDLILRLKDIHNWIKFIPFTDKYPELNSYFKEYTNEEIQSILVTLNINDLNFIKQLEDFDKNVTDFNYEIEESRKLFEIIKFIYNELIEKYGRRRMVTELTSCEITKYGQRLDKMRCFYKNFPGNDEEFITYIVTKLSDYQRGILHQIFDSNLTKNLKPREIIKFNIKILEVYESLIYAIKLNLKKIKVENLNDNEKFINITSKIPLNDNLPGIYQVLPICSKEELDNFINELFKEELNILKRVFGEDLKNTNYNENLEKLSKIELAIYSSIMTNIYKKILIIQKEKLSIEKAKKKTKEFYNIFIEYGYRLEEVDDILKSNTGSNLMKEYLTHGTPKERRTQIINLIFKMLYQKCGPGVIGINGINSHIKKKTINE